MKYVIIGNSAAGIGCVEGIRQIDREGGIAVITAEAHHTYSRPLISYLLKGKTDREKILYRRENFYSDNNCRLLKSTLVSAIEPEEKQVVLSNEEKIPYDKLLVSTGSRAFIPAFEGLSSVKDKFTFMSLDDAIGLEKSLDKYKRVLIVGGGLIGLKCAEGIRDKVAHVTVLDLAERIMSSILDDGGAEIMQRHIECNDISFRLGASIKRFESNSAFLENGDVIEFDILVLAVGVSPNDELLNGIADTDRGIAVNEKSQTTAPGIYAAGDCTKSFDISSGHNKNMALLPNAYMQGECAGINMAGGEKTFDKAIPMNAIGFFGKHIITAGNYSGDVYSEEHPGGYKRIFYGNNRLNGYILIGNIEKAGIYTSLIREQTPLDTIDFELICKQPRLMAFAKDERMSKIGGV
ncbi:MAG: FAD-dependent oxidoreductase [Oscillospiraceae bacterium]|nr:FAD-dependent oxidoreductase [Oscillospiraceae bacterium]